MTFEVTDRTYRVLELTAIESGSTAEEMAGAALHFMTVGVDDKEAATPNADAVFDLLRDFREAKP